MAIVDDIAFDYTNKIMSRASGATSTVYTVNAAYSFVQDTFDELTRLDDQVPMSAQTPTSYTMINGWYIQEDLTKYLETGAIQTSGYLNEIHQLTLDGTYAGPDAANIGAQVTDDVADVGALLDYNNTSQQWWVRIGSATVIADNSVMSINGDAGVTGDAFGASTTGETVFANPYTLGTLEGTPAIYIYQDGSAISSWWSAGHFDILIKVRETGTDIDSKIVTVLSRTWTDLYDHFQITLTTAGQNAVPLGTADDLNNTTAAATVLTWAAANIGGSAAVSAIDIDFEFTTPFSYDIGDGNGVQDYSVQVDCNGVSLSNVYEVCKWATRDGATGTYLETQSDANAIDGEAYRYAHNTYSEVKASPFGTFAGGKFFGAQGVYFINLHADDAQAFQLVDNAGTTRFPPDYQAFSVSGVVSGDRVAVYPETGGDVNKAQYSGGVGNVAGDSDVVIGEAIPNDTPSAGHIIVVAVDELEEHVYRYASWATSTFTFPTAITGIGDATGGGSTTTQLTDDAVNFSTGDLEVGDIVYDSTNSEYAYVVSIDSATQVTTTEKTTTWLAAAFETNSLVQAYDTSDDAYVPYLYEEATGTSVTETTTIYVSNKSVITKVRKAGILPFVTSGTYGSTGYSATATRTTDSQYN